MAKNVRDVQIVLTEKRTINGKPCDPGFVLLEGTLAPGVSVKDVDLPILLKQARAVAVSKPVNKKEDPE